MAPLQNPHLSPSAMAPRGAKDGLPAVAPGAKAGYIALLSVLIVGAIASMAVIVLFITSLNTTLNSSDVAEGSAARSLADGCIETALQWITNQRLTANSCSSEGTPCNTSWAVAGVGTCSLRALQNIAGPTPPNSLWRIRATGSGITNTVKKYVEVEAYRPGTLDPMTGSAAVIVNWDECVDFSEPIANNCDTE